MPKVSIVVPVYNMQKYLAACIKSLKAQTLSDIEIILVDDGSSDNSPALCDAYAQENPMIRVVHKPNGGLTSAWKRGSEEATGDYIGYVDADDYILPDMYERMYTRACETGADIVCCGLTHLYEDDPSRKWTEQMEFRTDSLERETLANEIYPTLINDGSFMGAPFTAEPCYQAGADRTGQEKSAALLGCGQYRRGFSVFPVHVSGCTAY